MRLLEQGDAALNFFALRPAVDQAAIL
jgi:hypothetical protein